MFECPTPLSGNQELVVDRSRSFNFGSRSQLRRISPKEILASEFVFRHFVIVYLKHRPSKTEFYVAVMSNNSINDLGNLKIAKLHEKGPNKVTYLTTLHLQIISAHWEVLSIKLVFFVGRTSSTSLDKDWGIKPGSRSRQSRDLLVDGKKLVIRRPIKKKSKIWLYDKKRQFL